MQAVLAALIHRLNGGLNNAAMAFDLLQASSVDTSTSQILATGIAGVEQAARAAKLIDTIVRPGASSTISEDGVYLRDLLEMLRTHASQAGCTLRVGNDVSAELHTPCPPTVATASLARGLAAIARAGDKPLVLVPAKHGGATTLEIMLADR